MSSFFIHHPRHKVPYLYTSFPCFATTDAYSVSILSLHFASMSFEKIPQTDTHEQSESHEHHENLEPSIQTIRELENLEKDTHSAQHQTELKNDILSHIDTGDGLDEQELNYIHIVEDFFDNFLDERGIDDVSDDTKEMLIQRIQTHGYTRANLDSLAQNLHNQSAKLTDQSPQEKMKTIETLLAGAMGGHLLDQLDTAAHELPVHEQFAILAELQTYEDHLDDEQKEKKRKMREQLLADLFEWKNLEIYEVVIDASGRVIITMKNPHGETVTISYDPTNGTLARIDAGAVDDIVPADQTKIAQVIEAVRDQQSLPYDSEDTGTLLQFVADKI